MRRPAAACAAGFAAGIAVFDAAGAAAFVLLSAGSLLLFLLIYWNKIEKSEKNVIQTSENLGESGLCIREAGISDTIYRAAAVFLLFFMLGAVRYAAAEGKGSCYEGMDGETAQVEGRVLSEKTEEDKQTLVIRTGRREAGRSERILVTVSLPEEDEADGWKDREEKADERSSASDRISASGRKSAAGQETAAEQVLTGRIVRIEGVLKEPESSGNPGVFDYRKYLKSQGIRMTVKTGAEGIQAAGAAEGIWFLLNRLALFRELYYEEISGSMDRETAGLLMGIMFGDRTGMEDSIYEDFQKNGTAHLLAVSGLHISLIYGVLNSIFRGIAGIWGKLPPAAALFMYAAMSGFSPSVVRAVFMICVHMAADLGCRRYDPLSCISFCAFALLLYRPALLFSAGFQLSFLAVLTISIVMPRKGKIAGLFLMQAGMVPMTLKQFHYISPAALALNPPSIALAGIIVPAGTIIMAVCLMLQMPFLPAPILRLTEMAADLLCNMEEMLLKILIWMNGGAEETPLACRYMASPPAAVFLFYYAVLFFFFSEAGRSVIKRGRRQTVTVLVVFALISGAAGVYLQRGMLTSDLIFVDVGQGDCAHLKAGSGIDLLFDSGGSDTYDVGKNTLMPYLLGNGVSDIDLAVVSHLHKDHCGGLETVTEGVKIKKLMLSAAYRSRSAEIAGTYGVEEEDILFVKAGDVIRIAGVTIRVLAPAPAEEEEYRRLLEKYGGEDGDENELCLIARIEYKGTGVLFTGDISGEYEKELAEQYAGNPAAAQESGEDRKDGLAGGEDGGREKKHLGDRETENLADSLLKADILKVAHHGSKYSTCEEFLEAVSPSAAVIQVGTNFYGHPSGETVSRLQEKNVETWRNDLDGAVFVRMGRRPRIVSMKDLQRDFFRAE